jgi:hypothetical protein
MHFITLARSHCLLHCRKVKLNNPLKLDHAAGIDFIRVNLQIGSL